MSTLIVDEILDSGGGSINFVDGFTIKGNSLSNINFMRVIDSSGPPYDSAGQAGAYNGLLWYDDSSERMNILTPIGWKTLSGTVTDYPTTASYYGDRAVVSGGYEFNVGATGQINYFSMANVGNASDFGDGVGRYERQFSASNGTIKVMGTGMQFSPNISGIQDMHYITFATLANSTSFGQFGVSSWLGAGGVSDGDIAVVSGNRGNASVSSNDIRYFNFDNFNGSTDFGNLRTYMGGGAACGDGTYGVWAGGQRQQGSPNLYTANIDYVTLQTPANATEFGSISITATDGQRGCSDDTRGLHMGGYSSNGPGYQVDTIEYITIAVPSNATDFGNLTEIGTMGGAVSDGTYAWLAGGYRTNAAASLYNRPSSTIDYVTIQTPGNATDFGDLIIAVYHNTAESGD